MHRITRSPAGLFAAVFGLAYFAGGVAGFAITGLTGFADMDGPRLLGLFMINPLHNIVHLALGVVWLAAAAAGPRAARVVNTVLGVVLGLVTVLGFTHVLMFLGIHSLGDPDNFLHLASATLALYFGTVGAERLTTAAQPAVQHA